MEKYYCFGHMNPDTDSVIASITLANLKRELGINAEERVLGDINKETEFVLKYFNVPKPKYLNDVKIRIKDLNYRKKTYMFEEDSIESVYDFMIKHNTTGVPIVDESKKFIDLVTAKDILKKSMHITDAMLYTSYDNILKTIKGEEVVRVNDEIIGKINAVSFSHETFENNVKLNENEILIIGDRQHIIEYAINSKVKLIIFIGGLPIKHEYIKLAKKNKVNVIKTPLNTFDVARLILYSNYIKKLINGDTSYVVHEKDYYDDFISSTEHLQIDNFPVLDKNGNCLGLLRKSEINKPSRRKVILVDHNEVEQSAAGIEEAEITEIVDHHKIGRISTTSPINFRNMIVGSTNTIIYFLYKENNVKISKTMAGLMLAAIISDTLLFKSPTTTETDKMVAKELNKICKLNIEKFGLKMFKEGTSLEGMTIEDVLNQDLKTFTVEDKTFTISQMLTLNYAEILDQKEEYLKEIEKIKNETRSDYYLLAITDIINDGSYLMYDTESEELFKKAFKLNKIFNGVFVPKYVSRKKQLVPAIMDALEK